MGSDSDDDVAAAASATATALRREMIVTYRTLRIALIGAIGLLATSLIIEIIRADLDLRGSISAYFHSPSQSIFVGSLIAIGMSVIAIRGEGSEELFLNLAGVLAPVVALVPVAPPGMDKLPDALITNLKNNMVALIVVGLIATIALWLWPKSSQTDPGRSSSIRLALLIYTGVIVIGSFVFVIWESARPAFHYIAAISMFVCFGVVAAINWSRTEQGWHRQAYRFVTIGMAISLVVIGGYKLFSEAIDTGLPEWHTSVFWLEVIEIALFAGFWITQTIEQWNRADARAAGTG